VKTVTFLKDHPVGIKAGAKHTIADGHAADLLKGEYVTVEDAAEPTEGAEPKAKKAKKEATTEE
jgi:hypothetical protein